MIKPVLLWSDALILLLLWSVVGLVWLARNNEALRGPWRQVMRNRVGAGTALILAVYVAIGLLDSVHYVERLPGAPGQAAQYSGEVRSALDWVLTPLARNVEKTYSAPFATRLYAKETMKAPDGSEVRDFPRLKYGGAHLADAEKDFWPDLLARGGLGMLGGLVAWLFVAPASSRLFKPAGKDAGATGARHALLAICLLTGLLIALAPHYHLLGTDKVGQDVLYLSLKSIRTGLLIGSLTTLVMLPFALGLGIAAGYFGGRVDDVIQYLYTTLNSIPGVLLIAAAVLVVQVQIEAHAELFNTAAARSDVRLLALCGILGVTGWTGLARLLRAEALKLRELEFVQAARAFGLPHGRILLRHLLPNVMHLVLITVVLDFSGLVLAEAVLSYVGVGVDPGMISFGNMINGARLELAREPVVWWQLAAAFLFMFVLVLAANLFADQVREALDPKSSGRK
ncbi:MAG: ABC transporter permease [Pseudomonadota bacterium]|nr:ABC transporter permease [Pseudomonadota bacterium]